MAVSFIIMYAVMFLNADKFGHVMLSKTRTYMTLLMIAPMAVSMLLFMWPMYEKKKLNYGILGISILVFFASLFGLREQMLIKDVAYMKAMIPHHSSAIMVSQKATLENPETKKLAEDIIAAQKREIALMKSLIDKIEGGK